MRKKKMVPLQEVKRAREKKVKKDNRIMALPVPYLRFRMLKQCYKGGGGGGARELKKNLKTCGGGGGLGSKRGVVAAACGGE